MLAFLLTLQYSVGHLHGIYVCGYAEAQQGYAGSLRQPDGAVYSAGTGRLHRKPHHYDDRRL